MTVTAAEIARWRVHASTMSTAPAAVARIMTDIDGIEAACLDCPAEPAFRTDWIFSENLLAIRIHHWRRRLAEADGVAPPPDLLADVKTRIARRAVAQERLGRLRERAEARRETEAAAKREARREARRIARKARPKPTRPAPAPRPDTGQLDLF